MAMPMEMSMSMMMMMMTNSHQLKSYSETGRVSRDWRSCPARGNPQQLCRLQVRGTVLRSASVFDPGDRSLSILLAIRRIAPFAPMFSSRATNLPLVRLFLRIAAAYVLIQSENHVVLLTFLSRSFVGNVSLATYQNKNARSPSPKSSGARSMTTLTRVSRVCVRSLKSTARFVRRR